MSPDAATMDVPYRAGRRVAMVIDDCDDARELYADALRAAGYRVLEARDGREGQDLLLGHPTPTLVVLDLAMPHMDGHELLDLIRSYTRLQMVPTLVVTACADDVELGVPFAACLRKPVGGDEVLVAAEELVLARANALR